MKQYRAYKATPLDLKKAFEDHLEQTFSYRPEIEVSFDTEIWLPVEVEISKGTKGSIGDYHEFLEKLEDLLGKIPDKKEEQQGFPDPEFTLGDKLIMHMTGFQTLSDDSYIFDHETYDQEFIHEDEGEVTILIDENKPLVLKNKSSEKPSIMPMDLCSAIVEIDYKTVEKAIKDGFPINEVPVVAGMLAIHVAVDAAGNRPKEGRDEMIKLLLENGVNIDSPDKGHGYTALAYAMLNDDLKTVKFLLEMGADANKTSPDFVKSKEMFDLVIPYVEMN